MLSGLQAIRGVAPGNTCTLPANIKERQSIPPLYLVVSGKVNQSADCL